MTKVNRNDQILSQSTKRIILSLRPGINRLTDWYQSTDQGLNEQDSVLVVAVTSDPVTEN